MPRRIIKPHMTEARRKWLERLDAGPANRPHGVVGYDTMQLGWTEWNWILRATGETAPPPDGSDTTFWETHAHDGERLTDEGRRVLARVRESDRFYGDKAPLSPFGLASLIAGHKDGEGS